MKVAIIPARGGSKRIPRKNIKPFFGKPIIAWSIEAAIESACFDRVIVSTDDTEIAQVARQYGAETPFIRPSVFADDNASTTSVVSHALNWLEKYDRSASAACCIYATAPFIQAQDIIEGLQKLKNHQCNYVFTATSYPSPIQRAFRLSASKNVEMFSPEHFSKRSQDLECAFHDAAQFYWGQADAWQNEYPIFSDTSLAIVLPRHRVQDIDTLEDWHRAELMFPLMQKCSESGA